MSEVSIEISAGQEICVAATKTFVNTLVVLFELARILNNHISLENLSDKVKETIRLNSEKVIEIAKELKDKRDIFVLGNKITYPLAREFALKLKEICYIHAEGMMAGELKHGTIALIEEGVPVFGLIHQSNLERMESALDEVQARGAKIYKIGGSNSDFEFPNDMTEEESSVCLTTVSYLIAYHIARLKGLSIDKPRNLAKSVTVK
jgi:glucosamine--fructose-6-phosphate aminotransferase (isomerizing)